MRETRAAMVEERGEQAIQAEISGKANTTTLYFQEAMDVLKALAQSDWVFTLRRDGIEQTITSEQWEKMDAVARRAFFATPIERAMVMVAQRALKGK